MNLEVKVRPRVYVVDDERVISWTQSLILTQEGFEATSFYKPADLIKASDELAPDLVISDVVMPEMNGIELALHLREKHPACKVILFSGQADTSELLRQAKERGHHFDVLAKPVRPQEMLERVRQLVVC